MLSRWLADVPLQDFLREAYGREPYARAGAALCALDVLTWQVLDRVLASRPRPDVLVVDRARPHPLPPPRNLAQVQALAQAGFSLVVRKAEAHDPGLRALADDFARELDGAVTLQLFFTPQGRHGFGWHYDAEEVFILQTAGAKEYLLRENTVNPQPSHVPRDMAYERETSPLRSCTLLAGDWLHIPSGWWHRANCREHSLSVSVGVTPHRRPGT